MTLKSTAAENQSTDAPQSELAPLADPEPPRKHSRWWAVIAVAGLAAASPYAWQTWRRPLAASTPAGEAPAAAPAAMARLGFIASRENSDWRLAWDRDAVARLDPLGAMLTIRDGGAERMQFLDQRDLASGAVHYVPRSADLVFQLKVSAASGDVEEQIRVLGGGPEPATARSPAGGSRPSIGEAARTVLRPFAPPAARPSAAPAPTAQLDPPPEIRLPAPQDSLPAAIRAQLPPAEPPARPPAPPKPETAPAPPVRTAPAPSPPPAVRPVVVHLDPAPTRTVAAPWPQMVPRREPIDVQIRVWIDTKGKVVRAAPVRRTLANYEFVNSALAAAMVWTFAPATDNGRPVPGEAVLTFKFKP